jgi:hypothetical protein
LLKDERGTWNVEGWPGRLRMKDERGRMTSTLRVIAFRDPLIVTLGR